MNIIKQQPFNRSAGILMPISSLSSPYGIGTFGKKAFEFVDFAKKASIKYWQVLPLGPTSYGDSPYQSFSAFAGNPYFIDLDTLCDEGLLVKNDYCNIDFGDNSQVVDYEKLYNNRFNILKIAYSNWKGKEQQNYNEFLNQNALWIDEYSQYMAIKMYFGGKSIYEWDEKIRLREPFALEMILESLKDQIDFWKFVQFKFFSQWNQLKNYANQNGVQIIGDIPIYVSLDSADVWKHSHQFQLDSKGYPTGVAGVPPDAFSATGQLWGNPLYNWDAMELDGFSWWKDRMSFCAKMYDVIRIDHFVGIAHYYNIPFGDETAENGHWVDGPGEKLIEAISTVMDGKKVIAEDLGIVIQEVRDIQEKSGYPGMKVIEFGLDSEPNPTNDNLSHLYTKNTVVYGGTHDNETLVGFLNNQNEKTLAFAKEYFNATSENVEDIVWAIIKDGFRSVCDLAIFQMQDFLMLDNFARINMPSTLGGNWDWRIKDDKLTDELAEKISNLSFIYNR